MKKVSVEQAVGLTLCHDITAMFDGFKGPLFRRGHVIEPEDIPRMLDIGKKTVFVWEPEAGELHEEDAALRMSAAVGAPNSHYEGPSEGKMLLMKQDIDNPCIWTWEGELKEHPQVEEPRSFKFQGQDRWGPKSLHPYTQGTDILKVGQLRTGGDDTKWEISQEGRYRITVDVFHETVKAEKM